jgi:ferredoxin-NADP reductase/DMSO/TMAO reductase YedYZ heme-binding membrane subunit
VALVVHSFLSAGAGSLEDVSSTTTTSRRQSPLGIRPRIVPRWYRDAAGALTWLSMLLVVALWVTGSGFQALVDPLSADGLTSLGRIIGLVSADLLLIQVLLMARIPFVERAYGQDELARRHRLVGFWSFNLMLGHVLLITVGYAAGTNVIAEFIDLVLDDPGMLLALAGTLALTLVVVTSIRAARRKLRYEDWHLLHLYAYLGVGLALPHQLWTGKDFLGSPAATVYWWTLWAAAAGAILVWRVGLPLYRSARHRVVVERVVPEGAGAVSVVLRGKDLDKLGASAGQFFTWRFLDGPGWTRGNPYSLSAAPTPTRLRITAKDLGNGSRRLARLKPGTRVLVEGPFGRMHPGARTRRKVTLLAGGIGVTPLRALLEEFEQGPGDVTLVYRAHSSHDVVLQREIDALVEAKGARVYYALGPRIPNRRSWLPQAAAHLDDVTALRHLVPDVAEHDVFLCGAVPWMEAARDACLAAEVPPERIHLERFSW